MTKIPLNLTKWLKYPRNVKNDQIPRNLKMTKIPPKPKKMTEIPKKNILKRSLYIYIYIIERDYLKKKKNYDR